MWVSWLLPAVLFAASYHQDGTSQSACTSWGQDSMLSEAQIVDVLYWHNKARRDRAKKGQCANMVEMVWSEPVARTAAKYTSTCPRSHNSNRDPWFKTCSTENFQNDFCDGSFCLGENLAMGSGSCRYGGVHSESGACSGQCDDNGGYCTIKDMVYDSWWASEGGNTGCKGGHCTQVVWQNSELLGCGYKKCGGMETLLCNYLPLGNFNGDDRCLKGAECSKCPQGYDYCNDGLCSRFSGGLLPPQTPSNPTPSEPSGNSNSGSSGSNSNSGWDINNWPNWGSGGGSGSSGWNWGNGGSNGNQGSSSESSNYVCDNGQSPKNGGCCAKTNRCPSQCMSQSMSMKNGIYTCSCSGCPTMLNKQHQESTTADAALDVDSEYSNIRDKSLYFVGGAVCGIIAVIAAFCLRNTASAFTETLIVYRTVEGYERA